LAQYDPLILSYPGELLSPEAVFTHGKELLVAISSGLQEFDVYENENAHGKNSEDVPIFLESDVETRTYSHDTHTSYSLKYDISSYHNLDEDRNMLSFGSIQQYEDNHIVHCGHENPTPVGAILVGSSHGSWAKANAVQQDVARSLSNLLLHPSHLTTRIDKGLTLLRQVVRTENYDGTGSEVCSKLHTVSIHPLELFRTMRIKTIADSPFQHVYSNPKPNTEHPNGAIALKKQTRKVLSSIVTPDYPAQSCRADPDSYWASSGGGTSYQYKIGYYEGCLEYSEDLPGSFNFNYDALTGDDDAILMLSERPIT
jgi:hypothetical protein